MLAAVIKPWTSIHLNTHFPF